MPFSKLNIFEELQSQRHPTELGWVNNEWLNCPTFLTADGTKEPGFSVSFNHMTASESEFDSLSLWFLMTHPPAKVMEWCAKRAPDCEFTSFFLYEEAPHIRQGMLIASAALDREIFVNNYWVFSHTLKELFLYLDHLSQRKT
jgi:hypothetical protein